MARIQVLNLPAPPDEYPFALVIDRLGDECDTSNMAKRAEMVGLAEEMGARGVLFFAGTVEVDPIDHDDPPPGRYSVSERHGKPDFWQRLVSGYVENVVKAKQYDAAVKGAAS